MEIGQSLNLQALSSHNITATQAEKTLILVREFPYRTARELAFKVNEHILSADAIHKRLPELLKIGVVSKRYTRKCTVTNRKAAIWVPVVVYTGL